MAESTNISIRMDKEVKEQADAIFNNMGMNLTTAFNIFIRQTLRQGKIPFEIVADPFYSESNMKVLKASIDAANKGLLTEHGLIEE